MKRRARAGAAFAAALLAAACGSAGSPRSDRIGLTVFASPGRPLDVGGPTLAGPTLRLRALRGHVVVVNVWASWCRPCRQESRVMAAAARRFAARGVRFVGVDEHDTATAARAFATAAGVGYPQLTDPSGRLLGALPQLPQLGIPSTLVLDRSGRPAARIIGPASRALLTTAVRAALDDR